MRPTAVAVRMKRVSFFLLAELESGLQGTKVNLLITVPRTWRLLSASVPLEQGSTLLLTHCSQRSP